MLNTDLFSQNTSFVFNGIRTIGFFRRITQQFFQICPLQLFPMVKQSLATITSFSKGLGSCSDSPQKMETSFGFDSLFGERKKTRTENSGKRKKRDHYLPFLGNNAFLII